jgi:hypothetical protein
MALLDVYVRVRKVRMATQLRLARMMLRQANLTSERPQ